REKDDDERHVADGFGEVVVVELDAPQTVFTRDHAHDHEQDQGGHAEVVEGARHPDAEQDQQRTDQEQSFNRHLAPLFPYAKGSAIWSLRARVAAATSGARKMAVPITTALTPAASTAERLAPDMPPSISMLVSRPRESKRARKAR